jgi:hypothetical protein
MVGLLPIGLAVATALLASASARLPSLVSTLLVAYLALVANLGLVTLVLSPFRAVTYWGVAAAEGLLLLLALAGWSLRGRPPLPVATARSGLGQAVRDPAALLALAVLAAILAYELLLAVTVPANNWDSLTYHLARTAAWWQHGGIFWIGNAPSDRLNEFQPLAEQETLFLFAATRTGALFALPQYVAQLAILVTVYGVARRLGYSVRGAAASSVLVATFTLVGLEATTAQNDLVAASLPAVAACLLLGSKRRESALGGAALGMALGVKLTTALVWPALALLAFARGRRSTAVAAAGAAAGFVAIGMWGYVLNLVHTGHVLGHGGGRIENTASPSFPGSVHVGLHVLYRTLDLSVVSDRLIQRLALAGLLAAVAVALYAFKAGHGRRAALESAAVAVPLLSPLIVIGTGAALAYVTRIAHVPVRVHNDFAGSINRTANEDYAAFGPIGSVALLGAPVFTATAYALRRVDLRHLALAFAFPSFLVLLALGSQYNAFLTRFLLVPMVLTAPLVAGFLRSRAAAIAVLTVGALVAGLSLRQDPRKPWSSGAEAPWHLTQPQAMQHTWQPQLGASLVAYDQLVPARACVGAIVGPDEPSYLLWGPRLTHRVVYLPALDSIPQTYERGLFYVVISAAEDAPSADQYKRAGWQILPLDTYWLLAEAPHAGAGSCRVR